MGGLFSMSMSSLLLFLILLLFGLLPFLLFVRGLAFICLPLSFIKHI